MNEDQIRKSLEQYLPCVVCPHDMLKSIVIKNKPAAIVINTDRKGTIGEHWVAVYLKTGKRGEFFDSFGLPPLHSDVLDFLNIECPNGWSYSNVTLQEYEDTICGNLCICFLKFRSKGVSYKQFLKEFIQRTTR